MITHTSIINDYNESIRIIQEAQQNNKLVIFVGAGASISSGMPSWKKAVDQIKGKLDLVSDENDLLKIPQYYYNSRGKNEYTSLMRSIFKYDKPLTPSKIHKQLLDFNVHTIITTNYDCLLEQAAEENAEQVQIISSDKDFAYKNGGKEIIKIHGDFSHDNFVLKEDDYLNYSSNFKLIESYVKSLIGSKTILFIGYSFSDPDVKQLFSWVRNTLDKDMQQAYLINLDDEYDPIKANYYQNFNIHVLFSKTWFSVTSSSDTNSIKNPSDLLIWTLDQILSRNKSNSTLLSIKGLNYVPSKYIQDTTHNDKNSGPVDLLNWQKAIYNFDFCKLKQLKEEYEVNLTNSNPKQYLICASIAYHLYDYFTSYKYLRLGTTKLFHQEDKAYFFISQVNLKLLGSILQNEPNLSDSVRRQIKDDISHIDLPSTLQNMPIYGVFKKILNDIYTFKFTNDLVEELYNDDIRAQHEEKTTFLGFNGIPHYKKIEDLVIDYWYCNLKNYIFIDDFRENKTVYRIYLENHLRSLATLDKSNTLFQGLHKSQNIHIKSLDSFDIYVLLTYTSSEDELNDIINRFTTKKIKINHGALEYLQTITTNIIEAQRVFRNTGKINLLYWKLIVLCSHLDTNTTIVKDIVKSFKQNIFQSVTLRLSNIITSFLMSVPKFSKDNLSDLYSYTDKLISNITNNQDATDCTNLLRNTTYFLKKNDLPYDNSKEIERLIAIKANLFLSKLYINFSNEIQKTLKKYLSKISNKDFSPPKGVELYCSLVFNEIIEPNKKVEGSFITYLHNESSQGHYSSIIDSLVISLTNLYINNKVVDKKGIENTITIHKKTENEFILNPKSYNYDNFDLEWLTKYNSAALKNLANNKRARAGIVNCFVKQYNSNYKMDRRLLKIYFKYFALPQG